MKKLRQIFFMAIILFIFINISFACHDSAWNQDWTQSYEQQQSNLSSEINVTDDTPDVDTSWITTNNFYVNPNTNWTNVWLNNANWTNVWLNNNNNNWASSWLAATSKNPIRRMTWEALPLNLSSMGFTDNIPKTKYYVKNLSVWAINNMINQVASKWWWTIILPAWTLNTWEKINLKSNIKIIWAPNFQTKFRATSDIDWWFFRFWWLKNVSVEQIDAWWAWIQDIKWNNTNIRITHNFIHNVKNHNWTWNYSSWNNHFEISYNYIKNIWTMDWKIDTHHGCELRELSNSLILWNLFENCAMWAELSSWCKNSWMIWNWMKSCWWPWKIINSVNSQVLYNDFEWWTFQTDDRDPWMIQWNERNAVIKYNRFWIPKWWSNSVWKSWDSSIKDFSYNILAWWLSFGINKTNIINAWANYLKLAIPK